ncbi:MAG: hypothetical protein ABI036_02440 [Fibrobacteria bacterium]
MKVSKPRSLKLMIVLTAPFLFAACGESPVGSNLANGSAVVSKPSAPGNVNASVLLGKVGALRKTSAITLTKLVLTAVSSATPQDTVNDTVAVTGNDAVTVMRSLTLKPLRDWVISAKSLDMKDSVIHSGSTVSFYVRPADTTAVSLNLTSRYAMYQANFNALPDSISSTTPGTGKDKLNLNRVVLKVDGEIKADSVLASGYFAAGQNVSIYFDYITPGSHTVTLEAHGAMHTYSGVLYSGSSTFTVAAGNDDTRSVSLGWVGPTTGTGALTVTLGKVGTVVVNGVVSGDVL